jgi:mono/diheme cytochrome c family protein
MAAVDVGFAGRGPNLARPFRCGGLAGAAVFAFALLAGAACGCVRAVAQEAFPQELIKTGADIFARNCSPCHGSHMREPQGAFDLREFPHDAHERFVSSVTRGKNQMPPWGDLLKPEQVEALWAYVVAGER